MEKIEIALELDLNQDNLIRTPPYLNIDPILFIPRMFSIRFVRLPPYFGPPA